MQMRNFNQLKFGALITGQHTIFPKYGLITFSYHHKPWFLALRASILSYEKGKTFVKQRFLYGAIIIIN